ncbi:nucleotide disphospho-sugar-binding domain-containing protein [Dactylosporangium matsuzakiense]|uniref:Glycosyl transferase n=1 Tax=Dactylosporangium matsuzakiense TaxID=53360 RepID=A0A9W6KYA9_9ACTN|nr:nucleotide disphospho-sugar-binding domain-containing protein [Dactylosporangium matsuzakiense]UWZ41210.1 DUF1205 domain-containing protein [Dactylosporangium matsuzakiense]GLL07704.1 glycosyl transferase [Dactylosporangium matsuzakiense]
MRVLFTVSSWPTHYAALVPYGWALRAAGHEVRVLCMPSQRDAVARAGLPAVPILDGMEVSVHNRLSYVREALDGDWPYPWTPLHPVTGAAMASLADFDTAAYARTDGARYAAGSARSHDAAVAYARSWRPDLVIHDPVSTEGLLAAMVLGVPAVLGLWGPVGTHEPASPFRLLPADLGGSFVRHGAGPFSPDLVRYALDPCPDAIAPPVRAERIPVRYVPYNGPGTPPEPLPAIDRPRVCVTWSTALSTMTGPRSYALPHILEALHGLDVEIVLTATRADAAALGDVPPGTRVLQYCPLHPLLQQCDLVVHHGGSGSTMTAIATGTPQLMLTFASEQACTAQRTAAAGAARHVPGPDVNVASIRAAAAGLLTDPAHRRAAAELRRAAEDRPSPVDVLARLEKLAAA